MYLSKYGLVFGNSFLVGRSATGNWDPQHEANKIESGAVCASVWAPNAAANNRSRYCTKAQSNTHERIVSEDDITVVNIKRDHPSWHELADPNGWMHVAGRDRLSEYAADFKKLAARRADDTTQAGWGKGKYQDRQKGRAEGRGKGKGKGKGKEKGGGRASGDASGKLRFEAAALAQTAPVLKSSLKPADFAKQQADRLLSSLGVPPARAATAQLGIDMQPSGCAPGPQHPPGLADSGDNILAPPRVWLAEGWP